MYTDSAVSFGTSNLYSPRGDHSSSGESEDSEKVNEDEVCSSVSVEHEEPLQDHEIPENTYDFDSLYLKDRERVIRWVSQAKLRLVLLEAEKTALPPIGEDEHA